MKTAVILLSATLLGIAAGIPLTGDKPVTPTPPAPGYISPFANVTVPTCTTTDALRQGRNGMIEQRYRWKNFNVHPDRAYNQDELNAINNAMYNLMQVIPCVTFGIFPPESSPSGDYVRIIKGTNNGCNSYVGRLGGRQDMNLQSPGCMGIGTVMHEMIHALGFHHEQGRPDRDDHVNILWGNIQDGLAYAFDKYPTSLVTTFGVPYNLRSIMHYNSHDFSKNGQPTIQAKNGQPVGSTGALMDTDKRKLKAMYGC